MIKDLETNKAYTCTLALLECTKAKTKAGKDYLRMTLTDGEMNVAGNYWDWAGGDNLPPINNVYAVSCTVNEWNGTRQLNVAKMVLNKDADLNDFRPRLGPMSLVEEYYANALELIDSIESPTLKAICNDAFISLKNAWLITPAAKGVHHAYVAGNLIHSFNVAVLAKSIAETTHANVDLCIAGGLLHDIGKLVTYTWDGIRIDMTPYGQLADHIALGNSMLSSTCQYLQVDAELEMLLSHIILSHHGKREWGSPVEPRCIEALIVHHADNIDSTLESIRAAESNGVWTNKVYAAGNQSFLTEEVVDAIVTGAEREISWEDDVAECMKQNPSII